MSLLDWITGWKYVGNTNKASIKVDGKNYADPRKLINRIHPYIIKTLQKNISKNISHQARKWLKANGGHAPLGRTIRGVKNMPNFTGIGYAKGKYFIYKGKETHYYIDNMGHGGAVSHGMKIWRKKREYKERELIDYKLGAGYALPRPQPSFIERILEKIFFGNKKW